MPKIHKSYGFTETYLCYHDVRFFSRSWPASIDAYAAGLEGVWGPSILLRRWQVTPSQNGIILHVDIGDGSEVLDASPYLDAMAELLPGVRRMESTHAELTPREQAELEEIQRRAEPAAAAASAFFAGSFPAPTEQGCSGAVSLAPALKRLCRQYSYRYLCAAPRLYRAEKQTANGHFITLEFDTGRTGCEANVLISLEGPGFSRRIASILCHPTDQKDAESHLHKVFAALGEAEDTVLAKLDRMYPPSPEWYGSVRNA
jgi:hypothetical protein